MAYKIELHCDVEGCDVVIEMTGMSSNPPEEWMHTPDHLGHICPKHVPPLKDVFRFSQSTLDRGLERVK